MRNFECSIPLSVHSLQCRAYSCTVCNNRYALAICALLRVFLTYSHRFVDGSSRRSLTYNRICYTLKSCNQWLVPYTGFSSAPCTHVACTKCETSCIARTQLSLHVIIPNHLILYLCCCCNRPHLDRIPSPSSTKGACDQLSSCYLLPSS